MPTEPSEVRRAREAPFVRWTRIVDSTGERLDVRGLVCARPGGRGVAIQVWRMRRKWQSGLRGPRALPRTDYVTLAPMVALAWRIYRATTAASRSGSRSTRPTMNTYDSAPRRASQRDVRESRREAVVAREIPDHDRHGDPRQIAEEVEHPPGEADQALGGDGRHQRPGDRRQPVAEEGQREERDDRRRLAHEVRADDAGREQEPRDDRHLARRTQRGAAPHHRIGEQSGAQHADERSEEGQRGEKSRLHEAHPPRLHEVRREPGQEEPERGGERELAEVHPPELARAEHVREVGAGEGSSLSLRTVEVHEAATAPDLIDLGGVRSGKLVRWAVDGVPHEPPHDADRTSGDEHHLPAEARLDPHEHRGEERDADVLSRRVEPDRRGALALGEPRRHDAVVDRVRRRLQGADEHAHRHQADHTRRESEQDRRDRPRDDQHREQHARRDAVHQPTARDLEERVRPSERREQVAHLRRVESQGLAHERRRDREIAPVEVVDRDADEQQHHDREPRPRRTRAVERDVRSPGYHSAKLPSA